MNYIVKIVAKATDDNPNFKGETSVYYIAKDWVYDKQMYAEENAWKRKWAAEKWIEDDRKWSAEHEKYWIYEYEIVEV